MVTIKKFFPEEQNEFAFENFGSKMCMAKKFFLDHENVFMLNVAILRMTEM